MRQEDMFLRNGIIVAHFITALINIHCRTGVPCPFPFTKKKKKKNASTMLAQQKAYFSLHAAIRKRQKVFSRFLLLLLLLFSASPSLAPPPPPSLSFFSPFLFLSTSKRDEIFGTASYRRYAKHSHKIIIFDLNGLNERQESCIPSCPVE